MSPRVGLLVSCLVDLYRPSVAFAAIDLLQQAGCQVEVPQSQTCCGQPAYNNGDVASSAQIAQQVIAAFESFDYLVAPSGSCLGMIKCHYPSLFETGSDWHRRATELSSRCFEITSFLVDILAFNDIQNELDKTLCYHDGCSGLRELKIATQPRQLLSQVKGLQLIELQDRETCCGFGGSFSVKFGEVSGHLVDQKCQQILAADVQLLAAGDLGCLLNISGRLKRLNSSVAVYHVVEILAGIQHPAIGDAQ